MKFHRYLLISAIALLIALVGVPSLGFSSAHSFVLGQASLPVDSPLEVAQDVTPTERAELEELEKALAEIESEIEQSEQLYAQAYQDFEARNYSSAEETLRGIISRLVNPKFQELFEEDACEDEPLPVRWGCRFFEDVAPVVFDTVGKYVAEPIIRFTEETLFNEESDFTYDNINAPTIKIKLIESAERAHSTATNSIRLLQRVILASRYSSSRDKIEALEIAELGRELEFVRISPLLEESSGISFTSETPSGLRYKKMQETARQQDSTIVYFSVVSPEELFVWVISPDEDVELAFEKVDISARYNTTIDILANYGASVASSYVIDRGNTDQGQVVGWSRDLRSLGNRHWRSPEDYVVDEVELNNALRGLYEALLEPVEAALPQVAGSQIVIVPQGPLFSVPFSALRNSLGEYLSDRYTIRIAPNLKGLRRSNRYIEEMPSGEEILFVGNPEMPVIQLGEEVPQQLPSLDGAQVEAETLAVLFGNEALTGAEATEARIVEELGTSKIVHLATHGILDDENSLFDIDLGYEIQEAYGQSEAEYLSALATKLLPGAIALAPSDGYDGLLTSQEIISLDLSNAELVVLSACNTARGVPGDSSILGLPFALGTAGTSRALVSLWPVPDEPTKQLMIHFYNALKSGGADGQRVDPAEALHYSMQEMKNSEAFSDPVNWAGFTLIEISQK